MANVKLNSKDEAIPFKSQNAKASKKINAGMVLETQSLFSGDEMRLFSCLRGVFLASGR